MRGAFLHVATDLVAFVGTAIAGAFILITGWDRFDPIAGLLVAALMLWSSWPLVRESDRIFLEAAPAGIDPDAVARALVAEPDVVEVHDLHVWTVTSGFPALSAHVLVAPGADCHDARRGLQDMLAERFDLHHTTLQVDHLARRAQGVRSGCASAVRSRLRGDLVQGKTAIVTGASSGIGPAIAAPLAAAGRAGRRRCARVERLETEVALELDVTDPESCAAFVDAAVDELGGIDILVNDAGLALGRAPFDESTEEDERACSRRTCTG